MQIASQPTMRIIRSFLLASGVAIPWLTCILFNDSVSGSIASFGAYLIIISFPFLPKSNAWQILLLSALLLSLFATLGASVTLGSLPFFIAAAVVALIQGISELKGRIMRLPLALCALAFFLSVGQAVDGDTVFFSLCFFSGTLWGGLVALALVEPSVDKFPPVETNNHLKNQQSFLGSMLFVSLIGSIVATVIPSTHPCWLPAAALRVMKPTRQQTKKRMSDRALGSLLGACFGGLLLGLYTYPLLHVFFVLLLVFSMLMIGAKHYAVWTFCLTAVALTFNSHPGTSALIIAADRVLLTVGGLIIAALALLMLRDTLFKSDAV